VDSKDFQLLVALYDNARQSYQSLGRRVSLSAHVVRDRLNRLKSKGILQGFMLSIDSSVFVATSQACAMDVFGEAIPTKVINGHLHLSVSHTPVFIEIQVACSPQSKSDDMIGFESNIK
jgi:DNA-binding Lrp family transcriptional regulator